MPLVETTGTDADGWFDFGEVVPGHYTLIVDDGDWGTSNWFDVEVKHQAKETVAVTIDVSPNFPDCKGGHEFIVRTTNRASYSCESATSINASGRCNDPGLAGENGYNIFDAIQGAVGSYKTIDMYGQIGFAFSEDWWSSTLNQIDSWRNPIITPDQRPPLGPYPWTRWTTWVQLGDDSQVIGSGGILVFLSGYYLALSRYYLV